MMTKATTKQAVRILLQGLFVLGTFWLAADAFAQAKGTDFDHLATGFPLTGGHAQQACEACHLQGVFKGTPRQCERCHVQGSQRASSFKPSNHVQTTRPCDECHTSNVTWLGARFDHVGVVPGGCPTCHNGVSQVGKPPGHPITVLPCDSCHRTTTWMSAYFDHAGVAPHDCTRCHDTAGTNYVTRPSNHITLPMNGVIECDWCHRPGTTWTVSTFNHAATQGVLPQQCTNCHNGVVLRADVKGGRHIPTTGSTGDPAACDTCHYTTAWTPHKFTHSTTQGVTAIGTGNCNRCHGGATDAPPKGSSHPNNPAEASECDTCHLQFTTWAFTHMAGATVGSGGCAGCHNGGFAGNYPSSHFPVTSASVKAPKDCDVCHKTLVAGGFGSATHHASSDLVTGGCYVCHSGSYYATYNAYGTAQKSGHPSTGTTSCDACHNTTSFNN